MGFNSAFKGLKLLKTAGNGRLNNLNDPVLNVLKQLPIYRHRWRPRRRLLMHAAAVRALRVAGTIVFAGYILALKYIYVTWAGDVIFVPVCADRWDKSSHIASHLSLIPKPS